MRVVATYNIKGGVGKTSAAVNLAYLAAAGGSRTLLWDLDPQGAATFLFRIRPKVKGGGAALVRGSRQVTEAIKETDFERLDLMPADFTYRNLDLALDATRKPTRQLQRMLAPLERDYDLVVLDCPPSVSLVSENVLRAADLVVVPLIPAVLSARTFTQLTDFLAELPGKPPRVLAFFSMVDRRKRGHRQLVEQLPREHPGIRAIAVPALSVVERMAEERAPVVAYAPRSPASAAYRTLWAETVATLDGRPRPPRPMP